MGVTRFGAYSTFININSKYVRKIPDSWNFHDGASFIVNTLTAYYGLVNLANI